MQSKLLQLLLLLVVLGVMPQPAPGAEASAELQRRFDAALAAIEAKRLRTARDTLRGLVAENPSLLRARLELARVHYLTGDYARAREQVEQVLADPELPPQVRVTVLAFLAQIDADERRVLRRSRWSGSVYGGLMYDTNVNFGPSREIIDIGGLPFAVSPESREQSDPALVFAPALMHTWDPQRRFEVGEHTGWFLWQSQATGYYRAYLDEDDFNLGVLSLRTGPAWVVPQRWRAGLGLQGDQIWLGDRRLGRFATVNPSFSWSLDPATELTLETTLTRRHYQRAVDRGRRGWYKGGTVTLDRDLLEGRLALQAGGGYAVFDATSRRFSYRSPEAFVGLAYQAWRDGTVFSRAGYRRYSFRGPEPLFLRSRTENEVRLVLGFEHGFSEGPLKNWLLQGSWAWTDNDSNLALYDYDRSQLSLGLARRF